MTTSVSEQNALLSVLVVDDQATQRQFLCRLLEREDVHTAVAKNGKQALEVARALHPDVVLMDVNMPEMDGVETVKHLRADPSTSNIPIIMVTTRRDEQSMEQSFVEGCNDYVLKPVEKEELLAKLEALTGRSLIKSEAQSGE